jgi:hypothetical protein
MMFPMATSGRRTAKRSKPERQPENRATPDPPRKRKGRPPKLGDHQLFSLRLPTDLHRALKTYAFVKGRSFNDVLVDVIRAWWNEQAEREHIEALVRMGRENG